MMGLTLLILPQILIVVIITIVKYLMQRFMIVELALELHVSGITYLVPLSVSTVEMAELLTLSLFLVCSLLSVTIICYFIVDRGLNGNVKRYERTSFLLGFSVFLVGLIFSITLS